MAVSLVFWYLALYILRYRNGVYSVEYRLFWRRGDGTRETGDGRGLLLVEPTHWRVSRGGTREGAMKQGRYIWEYRGV